MHVLIAHLVRKWHYVMRLFFHTLYFVGRTQHEGWKDVSWIGKERLAEAFGVMAAEKDRQTSPVASTLETSASHLASIWGKTAHLGSPNDPERRFKDLPGSSEGRLFLSL